MSQVIFAKLATKSPSAFHALFLGSNLMETRPSNFRRKELDKRISVLPAVRG
jgi:hypothetical protein